MPLHEILITGAKSLILLREAWIFGAELSKSGVLGQLAKGVRIEEKQAPNRGVFKKPKSEPVRASVPNSVFALGKALMARG